MELLELLEMLEPLVSMVLSGQQVTQDHKVLKDLKVPLDRLEHLDCKDLLVQMVHKAPQEALVSLGLLELLVLQEPQDL
jgi:hypothetical protein